MTHSAGTSCGHGAGAEGTQPGGSVFWGHLLREGGLGVPPPGRNRSVLCQEDCRPYLGNLLFLQAAGLGPGDQRAAGLLPGLCPLTHLAWAIPSCCGAQEVVKTYVFSAPKPKNAY